jgi:hypothetical protein
MTEQEHPLSLVPPTPPGPVSFGVRSAVVTWTIALLYGYGVYFLFGGLNLYVKMPYEADLGSMTVRYMSMLAGGISLALLACAVLFTRRRHLQTARRFALGAIFAFALLQPISVILTAITRLGTHFPESLATWDQRGAFALLIFGIIILALLLFTPLLILLTRPVVVTYCKQEKTP